MTNKLQNPAPFNSYRLIFLSGILILAGLLLYRILLVFSYNGEIGGIDNNFVYDVLRNIDRGELYTDPSKFPYAITLYAPLFYDLCTGIDKLWHINPDEPIQVYQLCRTVSLACDIMTCITLYGILRRRFSTSKEVSCLFMACFATILCFLGYTFSRCDSLFLAFYALSIYTLTDVRLLKSPPLAVFLALLTVACIFSKQNGILLPVLVTSWLLLHRARKVIVYYVLGFVVFFVVLLFIHIYLLHYTYLAENTVKALNNRFSFLWFSVYILKRMFALWPLPLYIAILIVARMLVKPVTATGRSLAIIFIIQLLFGIMTSLKLGSSVGYFNESFFLSFIIIAYWINPSTGRVQVSYTTKIIAWSLIPVFLFFFFTAGQGYLYFLQHREQKKLVYEQQKQVRDWLQPKLAGHYIMNIASPNIDFFKTLFHKEIAVPNLVMVGCCTFPEKNFDYTQLLQDLNNGKIAWIIAPEISNSLDVLDIPQPQFQKDTLMNGFTIYKFR
jgi:hypothetical protein